MGIDAKSCPSSYDYNVFGLETTKNCCYRFHKYCDEVKECNFKQIFTKLKAIKEHCEETIRVMGDTGNNPYAQGRTIEAKRVLEILGDDNGN